MKSIVYHIQINVSDKNKSFSFYKELLGYLGHEVMYEDKVTLGMGNGRTDIWLIQTAKKFIGNRFHRKNIGLNHVSFRVETKKDVDRFVEEFLKPKEIGFLYDSPKEFPEYGEGYYAVYFEDPDRIKLEVTFKP